MRVVAEREVAASEDRGALAKMVMTLLDHWKLSTEDRNRLASGVLFTGIELMEP